MGTAARRWVTLRGVQAAIYTFLDRARSFEQVAERFDMTLEAVRALVTNLEQDRLVYQDGHRVLALALPDRARKAFATESAFGAPAARGPVDADLPWTEGAPLRPRAPAERPADDRGGVA